MSKSSISVDSDIELLPSASTRDELTSLKTDIPSTSSQPTRLRSVSSRASLLDRTGNVISQVGPQGQAVPIDLVSHSIRPLDRPRPPASRSSTDKHSISVAAPIIVSLRLTPSQPTTFHLGPQHSPPFLALPSRLSPDRRLPQAGPHPAPRRLAPQRCLHLAPDLPSSQADPTAGQEAHPRHWRRGVRRESPGRSVDVHGPRRRQLPHQLTTWIVVDRVLIMRHLAAGCAGQLLLGTQDELVALGVSGSLE